LDDVLDVAKKKINDTMMEQDNLAWSF